MKTSSDISTRKLVIGSAAIAVLAAVIFFFAFFQVKTVEVMGNDHYSDDELKERIIEKSDDIQHHTGTFVLCKGCSRGFSVH